LDELFEIDVIGECHARRMNVEDAPFGGGVGHWELDFAVDTAGAQQRRVQTLDSVRGHNHLTTTTPQRTRRVRASQ
jgi:hypothetical protein